MTKNVALGVAIAVALLACTALVVVVTLPDPPPVALPDPPPPGSPQYRVIAEGFDDGECECSTCGAYNGTFVCTYEDLGPDEDCTWLSEVFEGCDGGGTSQDDQWKIVMTFTGGSNKIRAFAASGNIMYEAENACCGSMTLTRQAEAVDCTSPETITVESVGF